jgi:hypothetical protein
MGSSSVPPVGRANNLSSFGYFIPVTIGRLNNCNNTLCYTYNHNYIYQPHSGYGKVGTTAAAYLASRKRL